MSNSNLDIAILEVGLGGRLDAVNLIDPQLSIITGVALDHQQWLGSDLDSIAREKAAIGRSGIVMLYGDTKPVHGLVQAARNLNVKLLLNGKDFCFDDFDISNLTYLPHPSIACAVKASKIINPDISKEVLNKGLNNTQIDGRFHKIKFKDINIILDVAHNPQATSLLAERLLDLKLKNKVIAITGMMSDKDIIGILTPLVEIVSSWHFCSTPNNERACSAKKIAAIFEKLSKTEYPRNIDITDDLDTQNSNVKSESCDKYEHFKVEDAIELALKLSNKEDTIVIFGSFLIVGAALNWLNKIN
jgi:dihydrofolate synthase/folylpolyglutamate synthase